MAENQREGYIKLYRSMLTWEWWDDINTFRLFVTILLSVNWKERKWHGRTIPRGSMFTSLNSLSKKSGLTLKQTRVALNHLIETNEVASEGASNGRIVTVVKYELYQDFEVERANERASERANEGQTRGKQRATTKEVKEVKEVKEDIIVGAVVAKTKRDFWQRLTPDDIDSVYSEYPESAGYLIDEVAADVVRRKAKVKDPVAYILGFARRSQWDDKADHFADHFREAWL